MYGYVYLTAYYWISFKNNKDFNNFLVKSIATSYLLTNILDLCVDKINITFSNNYCKVIFYFSICAILGLVVGKILSHRWFNIILDKLHIGRTTNENIWDDIIKPYTAIRVFMKDGTSYYGQYKYGEPFKSEPIIALTTYQKLNQNNDVVIDNTKNPNELIVLNTKDFEKIEVVYLNEPNEKLHIRIKNFFKEIKEV